jgi:hypothetical protein
MPLLETSSNAPYDNCAVIRKWYPNLENKTRSSKPSIIARTGAHLQTPYRGKTKGIQARCSLNSTIVMGRWIGSGVR